MKKLEGAYHHGDLRNALVEEAVRVIEREGSAAFSLREVARRVGVSPNAAYRHFADKNALLVAVAAHGRSVLARTMRERIEAVTVRGAKTRASDRLRASGHAYVGFALARPDLFRVTFEHSAPPAATSVCTEDLDDPYALLAGCLDGLVEAQVITAKRRPGAELFAWCAVHGYATLALGGGGPGALGALDRVLDFVLEGLRGPLGGALRR